MRILITGAAGFLGSHLCDRLLADGHEVIGMDNFITGSRENIAHLASNEKFSFYKHDVSNYIYIAGKVDAVMHFASPASPNPKSPITLWELPKTIKPDIYWLPPAKFMVIRWFTRRRKIIPVMWIQPVNGLSTMRPNASQNR